MRVSAGVALVVYIISSWMLCSMQEVEEEYYSVQLEVYRGPFAHLEGPTLTFQNDENT